ncbi:MAG: hypothetical protein OMM_13234, partial [Candidatus Magnetoglobus multicellularis str. Araruama]
HVGTLNMNGGSINFVMLSGDLNIDEIGGVAGDVIVTVKDGDVSIKNNDTGNVTIIAETGAVDVSLEADTLSIIANGDINIVEADDVVISEIVQNKAGGSITINAGGNVTLSESINLTQSGMVNITAGNDGTGTLTINSSITSETGAITLTAGSGMTFSEEASITTDASITLNAGDGDLTMGNDTIINAGSGAIDIDAGGTIGMGTVKTTGTDDLSIISTNGAVVDINDHPLDIQAPQAKLIIQAKTGIGALDTQVAFIDLTNTESGNIEIEEQDTLTISNISQTGSGTVTIQTIDGAIVIDSDGTALTSGTGTLTIQAGGETNAKLDLNDPIQTTGGGVSLITESGNLTLSSGIEITGSGNIVLKASEGAIQVNPELTGWLTDYTEGIEWALKNGRFAVDVDTGKISLDDQKVSLEEKADHFDPSLADQSIVLREAEGVYLQTTDGGIFMEAKTILDN